MDAAGGGAEELALPRLVVGSDPLGGGVDPEEALDGARRAHGLVDEGAQVLRDVGVCRSELLSSESQRLEEPVAGSEALVEEGGRDRVRFVHVGDVLDDAEEVAGVGAVGESAQTTSLRWNVRLASSHASGFSAS